MFPSALSAPSSVPIIGQPIQVQGYTIVLAAVCQCGGPQSALQLTCQMGPAGLCATPAACPSCHNVYAVNALDYAHGQLQFSLQMQRPSDT